MTAGPLTHFCAICATTGKRIWGAWGFSVWPAVAKHKLAVAGSVWACEAHKDEMQRRAAEARG